MSDNKQLASLVPELPSSVLQVVAFDISNDFTFEHELSILVSLLDQLDARFGQHGQLRCALGTDFHHRRRFGSSCWSWLRGIVPRAENSGYKQADCEGPQQGPQII